MITLDRETHTYYRDGTKLDLPSITEIIAPFGRNYAGIDPFYAERGTAIHAGCALLNSGDLDWDSVDPAIRPYLRAYEKFLADGEYIPTRWEEPLESKLEGFCGTFDLTCLDSENRRVLLDIKSSKSVDPVVELQLGGQEILISAKIDLRGYLRLGSDESYSIRFMPPACEEFRAALRLYRWKQSHSRKK